MFRVLDGKAARTKVELGQRRDGRVEVVKGVAPGETIVTAGQLKLRDGVSVTLAAVAKAAPNGAGPKENASRAGQGRQRHAATRSEVLIRRRPAMQLPEICIKRPVFATVMSLIILLVGLISYTRLSVREYPRIDEPVVSVSVTYRGASAEVVESQVTKPLEDSLAGIEGVEVMTSQSRSETARINVRFSLKRDPDSAAADVRDKVARARGKLPDTIDEPIIAKVEADSQPGHLHRRRGRLAHAARGVRLREALRAAAALGAARRGRRADLRRAPGVDAPQHRPHAPRRLQADRAGRRGRAAPAERRDSRRPHRIAVARVHRRRRDRPAHAGAVQQHHRRQRRRLPGAHPRHRQRGDRRRSTSARSRASTASRRSTSA